MKSVASSAKLYDCTIIDSFVGKFCSIGDKSKVSNSSLDDRVIIDRYNLVDSSTVGRYSYTGKNTIILYSEIGSFTSISWNVSIGGANHDYRRICQHSILYDPKFGVVNDALYDRYADGVKIGSDVWIGCGAVVLRNTSIGHGAVVGANAVVTKDVPPFAIVAGNPAKVIKYRFDEKVINELLSLAWWDWEDSQIRAKSKFLSKILG